MKFISPDNIHRYIRKLAQTIDIEFTDDYNKIKNSNKKYIIWNPYGYLAYPNKKYIDKYNMYKLLREQGKTTYVVERGALPDCIFIDKYGFLCDSESYDKKYWLKDLTDNQHKQVSEYIESFKKTTTSLESQNSNLLSEKEFFQSLNARKEKFNRVVFVPLQMKSDTVTKLWCDWVENVDGFVNVVQEIAKDNQDILFILKNHPNEDNTLHFKNKTDNIVIADECHYKDAIKHSDVVLTINSGVGLQAMMWHKPTIIVGHAFYQFDEINTKAHNKEDIVKNINNFKRPIFEYVEKFIYYLKFVFYTTCIIQDIGNNCSEPKSIEKITYLDENDNRVNHETEVEEDTQRAVFLELLNTLDVCCLKDVTCLECIQHASLIYIKNQLHIGTDLSNETKNKLIDNGFIFTNEYIAVKNNIKVFFSEPPLHTKKMKLWGATVFVPLPVLAYLRTQFGVNWKEYKLEKQEVVKPKNKKLNILYLHNMYGWVFEFEAQYYKKHSKHNVIPCIQTEAINYINKGIDIVVVPSAWHWVKDLSFDKKEVIEAFKNKNIKMVCQYNSEIEHVFDAKNADLIVPSSLSIKDFITKKYNYKNAIMFPHFVDTTVFKPKYKWNDFTVGFAGNIKNRYKRPEIISKLEKDFKFLKKCEYHGHLKTNRQHSEIVDFYNDIDIYVSPSISEGTPYTMLEAMSCEKIVFITDVGIARFMLDSFFIIPNTTDEEIYQEFVKRINILKTYSVEKLKSIGRNNRKRVELLSWKDNVGHLDEFYKALHSNNLEKCKKISTSMVDKIKK